LIPPQHGGQRRNTDHFKFSLFGKKLKHLSYFFWVIPQRLNFMCRRFGTFCSILKGGISFLLTPPVKMELTGCSETSGHKIRTPVNHSKEIGQYSEHGESLKSNRNCYSFIVSDLVSLLVSSFRCVLMFC